MRVGLPDLGGPRLGVGAAPETPGEPATGDTRKALSRRVGPSEVMNASSVSAGLGVEKAGEEIVVAELPVGGDGGVDGEWGRRRRGDRVGGGRFRARPIALIAATLNV